MSTLDELIAHQQRVVGDREQRLLERGVNPGSTPIQVTGAAGAVTEQRHHLDQLLARQAARDEAIATHETAEREHADNLVLLGQELQDARRELADHVSAAIAALDSAWTAAESYDALLAERSAWLREIGMPARYQDGRDDEVRFGIGGHESTAFGNPRLRLADQLWHPVAPDAVAEYVRAAVLVGHRYLNERRTSTLHELLDPVTRRPTPVPPQPVAGPQRPMVDPNTTRRSR